MAYLHVDESDSSFDPSYNYSKLTENKPTLPLPSSYATSSNSQSMCTPPSLSALVGSASNEIPPKNNSCAWNDAFQHALDKIRENAQRTHSS